MNPTCDSCPFWEQDPPILRKTPDIPDPNLGFCHRFPNQTPTKNKHWCAEHPQSPKYHESPLPK